MKRFTKTKTVTIGDIDNPMYSLLLGHVGAKEFNKAFDKEGWQGGGWIPRSDLNHEYWRPYRNGMKRCEKDHKDARPFTVMAW